MGEELFPRHPEEVDAMSEILSWDIREYCEDPTSARTDLVQPSVFLVSYLRYIDRYPVGSHDVYMGHSVGEYTALAASGAIEFQVAARLVATRGQVMHEYAPAGGMAAIIGLSVDQITGLLDICRPDGPADIANLNSPVQTVVAGPERTLHAIAERATSLGAASVPLKTGGPFHSRYMRDAARHFAEAIPHVAVGAQVERVLTNVTGRQYTGTDIAPTLSKQIVSPVRWVDQVLIARSLGVARYDEFSPKPVLERLVRETLALADHAAATPTQPTHSER